MCSIEKEDRPSERELRTHRTSAGSNDGDPIETDVGHILECGDTRSRKAGSLNAARVALHNHLARRRDRDNREDLISVAKINERLIQHSRGEGSPSRDGDNGLIRQRIKDPARDGACALDIDTDLKAVLGLHWNCRGHALNRVEVVRNRRRQGRDADGMNGTVVRDIGDGDIWLIRRQVISDLVLIILVGQLTADRTQITGGVKRHFAEETWQAGLEIAEIPGRIEGGRLNTRPRDIEIGLQP